MNTNNINSGILWSEYSAGNAAQAHHAGGKPWSAAVVKASRDALYAQWEAAVVQEIEAQNGAIEPGQQWGGHASVEAFLNRSAVTTVMVMGTRNIETQRVLPNRLFTSRDAARATLPESTVEIDGWFRYEVSGRGYESWMTEIDVEA